VLGSPRGFVDLIALSWIPPVGGPGLDKLRAVINRFETKLEGNGFALGRYRRATFFFLMGGSFKKS